MKIEKPFDEYAAVFNNTGEAGDVKDLMLSFIIAGSGDTGQVLPPNSFVKYILTRAESNQSQSIGIPDNNELFFREQFVYADTAASSAPNVWLPDESNIEALGIEGPTRIVIIYQIIPLLYA